MKKLIILIVMVFCFSCEKKEPEFCWKCDLFSQWNDQRVINTSIFCDKTEKEVFDNKELWKKLGHRYECNRIYTNKHNSQPMSSNRCKFDML